MKKIMSYFHFFRYKSLSASAQDLTNLGVASSPTTERKNIQKDKSPTRNVRFNL